MPRSTLTSVPKSKGRQPKRRPNQAGQNRSRPDASPEWSTGQAEGTPSGNEAHIAALLDSDQVNPDLLIEMLPPLLWLCRQEAPTRNLSVDSSMVLQHAYEHLGIAARVCPVDVVVKHPSSNRHTMYGRPDPGWDEEVFDGHCVVWLPQSGRLVDTTVEQFPEVRRQQRGPVVGRAAFTGGSAPEVAAMRSGEMPAGMAIPVVREGGLMLLYTITGPDYRDIVTSSPLVQQIGEQYRRAGVNLASHAVTLLRLPTVVERVRRAPYPRLHRLLDTTGLAEFVVDRDGDFFFTIGGDDADERSLRLDEISAADVDPALPREPERQVPHFTFDRTRIKEIMNDVDTDARIVQSPTAAMGEGGMPVVLFEPRAAVGIQPHGEAAFEAQAEGIITAGFARFRTDFTRAPHLSSWSVRRTPEGLELWDHGGIWARAVVEVDHAWLASAAAHGTVRVIYGICVGVRLPSWQSSYTDADRDAELLGSRRAGIAAAAEIPWTDGQRVSRSGWWQRMRRSAPRADRDRPGS